MTALTHAQILKMFPPGRDPLVMPLMGDVLQSPVEGRLAITNTLFWDLREEGKFMVKWPTDHVLLVCAFPLVLTISAWKAAAKNATVLVRAEEVLPQGLRALYLEALNSHCQAAGREL